MRCMKPNMRWLDKVKSTLQPDEPKKFEIFVCFFTKRYCFAVLSFIFMLFIKFEINSLEIKTPFSFHWRAILF